jgi:uncharacterized protein YndB with AHSA1/START domain
MAANEYRFVSHWHVEGSPDQVFAILDDPADYVRWWPSVWLEADLLEPAGSDGTGRQMRFVSRGRLPYRIHWTARTVDVQRPTRIVVRAEGEFEGIGEWTIRPAGPSQVEIEYVWTVTANKPLLRYLSPIFKPLFEANHRWAMARGEESLRQELARRRTLRPSSI